jgi:hypothetical protein
VARGAFLVDRDQQGVAVAVEGDALDPLAVAGGVALAPVLGTGPRVERHAAAGQGAPEGLLVHPAEHEHLEGVVLLHDGGDEAGGILLQRVGDGRIEGGAPLVGSLGDGRVGLGLGGSGGRHHP